VNAVLGGLRRGGFDPIIWEAWRSDGRQRWLYGMGREYSDGRPIVTNSRDGDESWHFYGLAADIYERVRMWNLSSAFRRALAEECLTFGLTWGGDWNRNRIEDEKFVDAPHIQWYIPGMHFSPSPRAARLYAQGGVEAVWRELRAI
jgi:hypothetical protein